MRLRMGWLAVMILCAMLVVPIGASASSSAPVLRWSPQTTSGSYDFGAVPAGQTSSQKFKLTNTGGKATRSLVVNLSGSSGFSVAADSCTAHSLGPTKSCTVTVTYAPTTAGQSDTGTLTATGIKPPASASITLAAHSPTAAELLCDSYGGTYTAGIALVFACDGLSAGSQDDAVAIDAAFRPLCLAINPGTDTHTYVDDQLVVFDGAVQPNTATYPSANVLFTCVFVP